MKTDKLSLVARGVVTWNILSCLSLNVFNCSNVFQKMRAPNRGAIGEL